MIKKIGEGWGWGRDDRKRIIYQTGQYDNNDRRRKERGGMGGNVFKEVSHSR